MDKFYQKLFLAILSGSLIVFTTLHMKMVHISSSQQDEEITFPSRDIKSLIAKSVKYKYPSGVANKSALSPSESRDLVKKSAMQFDAEHEEWKKTFSTKTMSESTNILLVSYLGSGATKMADVLSRKSDTIYFYDPILKLGGQELDKVQLLQSLFNCDFKSELSRKYLKSIQDVSFFEKNIHFLRICRDLNLDLDECLEKEKMSEACSGLQNRLILLQTTSLEEIKPLVLNQNIKLIFMIRSPRGFIQTRQQESDMCKLQNLPENCNDPEVICNQYMADIKVSQQIAASNPQVIKTVVYEHFVFKPLDVIDSIYQWLSWKPNLADIQLYINSHTIEEKANEGQNPKLLQEIDGKCPHF